MMDIRNSKVKFYSFVIAIISFVSLSTAIAQVDFTGNQALFIADNPALALQTFQAANVPPGGIFICDVPVNANTNDDCFSPGDILPGIEFSDRLTPDDGILVAGENFIGTNMNPPNVLSSNFTGDDLEITFTQSRNAVGLTLGCLVFLGNDRCNQTTVVSVFDDGDILLGTMNVPVTDLTDSFLGISSNLGIARINLSFDVAGMDTPTLLDVRFDANGIAPIDPPVAEVPTLSEWGLIAMAGALGLVSFMVMRRRESARA